MDTENKVKIESCTVNCVMCFAAMIVAPEYAFGRNICSKCGEIHFKVRVSNITLAGHDEVQNANNSQR